jgi:hypothetical protein
MVAAQQLVATGCRGLDLQLRQIHHNARKVCVATEQATTDQHVIAAVVGRLPAVVRTFGPCQHVKEGHDVQAASLLGSDSCHGRLGRVPASLSAGREG